ncbi:hypothetical protein [Metabacillus niabensis]|uniref:hypothetical protein n=1 Tax=Metabacillus niabensis TaxID=324854 RepID=UPI0039A2AEBC
MPVGKQLKRNLKNSTLSLMEHKKFKTNIRNFEQNHREVKYQRDQKSLEDLFQHVNTE